MHSNSTQKASAESYAKNYAYMLTLEHTSEKTPILSLDMHTFFYLATFSPISTPGTHTRTSKLFDADLHRLFDEWHTFLPPSPNFEDAKIKIREWKRVGSCYVYIAQHLGIGALLYLHGLLDPGRMWGAWTGERAQGGQGAAVVGGVGGSGGRGTRRGGEFYEVVGGRVCGGWG